MNNKGKLKRELLIAHWEQEHKEIEEFDNLIVEGEDNQLILDDFSNDDLKGLIEMANKSKTQFEYEIQVRNDFKDYVQTELVERLINEKMKQSEDNKGITYELKTKKRT